MMSCCPQGQVPHHGGVLVLAHTVVGLKGPDVSLYLTCPPGHADAVYTPLTTASWRHRTIAHSKGALFYFRTPHKVQVFGVCCELLCRQVFLIVEAEQAGKGAVVVVSLVHALFHLHGLGERRVTLDSK